MYKITIVKTSVEETVGGRECHEGCKVCATMDDTPEIVKKKEVERKIYEQTVETMDVWAVIDAVLRNSGRKLARSQAAKALMGQMTGNA